MRGLRPGQQIASATQEGIELVTVIRPGLGDPEGELCFGLRLLQRVENAMAVRLRLLGSAASKHDTELAAADAALKVGLTGNAPEGLSHRPEQIVTSLGTDGFAGLLGLLHVEAHHA